LEFHGELGFNELYKLKDNDSFGELALYSNKPRSNTVKAAKPCYMAVIYADCFKGSIGKV